MAGYSAQELEHERAPVPISVRADRWWIEAVLVVLTLVAFSAYGMWRASEGKHYDGRQALEAGRTTAPLYLSPFYSPPVHEWFPELPGRFAISPAFLVLVFPLSFRFTCYYCRRSYYRAFFWDPPGCALSEPRVQARQRYTGENAFPFVLQNLHRYALYAILVVVAFHFVHLYDAFFYLQDGRRHFGIGLGTLVFAADTVLLSLYVFSCHSWRHMVGGRINRLSSAPVRRRLWDVVTVLNARHGLYFWLSLITVGLADFYVRLIASGALADPRFL